MAKHEVLCTVLLQLVSEVIIPGKCRCLGVIFFMYQYPRKGSNNTEKLARNLLNKSYIEAGK